MEYITDDFTRRITGTFGQAGNDWLANLGQLLKDVSEKWSISQEPPFQPLSYNYVAPAVGKDGTRLVLKVGVPNKEIITEIDALRHFDGQGSVKLIEADPELGALLLERLEPGLPIRDLESDEDATAIAAHVMSKLWKAPSKDHSFPHVSDWAKGLNKLRNRFDGKTGPFPRSAVSRAEGLFAELLSSMSDEVVLHGDLHHWNILSAGREPWLAIDPKGVIGEREYEIGAWLRNPFPDILNESRPSKIIARRIDQFAEILGFDRQRLIGWPGGKVLATSRERLQLQEEQIFAIQGLEFPDWELVLPNSHNEDAASYAAIKLFIQSAKRVQHDFALTTADLTYLTRICRLVEGIPLGIELAASWVDTLSLADIAVEIQQSLYSLQPLLQ